MTLSFNNYHSASFVLPSSPRRAAIHDEGTKLFSKTVILVLDNIRNYYVELLINWIKILKRKQPPHRSSIFYSTKWKEFMSETKSRYEN